ncbi:LysR family transcriptional regulator [Kitasatospora sp. NPDC096147]|uniref:LysR family transcriptional regulator n=1 Tax=Kitasatospora sp. NPDC096147 TaxID=3364093 RepID=UPI00381E6147
MEHESSSPPATLAELGPEGDLAALAPQLAQFAAVARLEHVTRAAELLGMPQPTLSRSVARLEAELGVRLLARQGRTVRLTRAGRLLLGSVERALAELERGAEAARAEADPAAGRVAFGFLHTMGSDAVPALLRGFRAGHPKVRFQLVQDYGAAMLERLRAGELDLCLVSPLPDAPDLTARPLDEQRLHLVVPADHRLAGRRRIRLAEAAEDPFVVVEQGYGLRVITEGFCAEAGFAPRIAFEGEEAETLRGLVAAGLGVALLPPALVPRPGVVELEVTAPRTRRAIGLAWVTGRPLTPPVAAFREFVLSRRGRLLDHD